MSNGIEPRPRVLVLTAAVGAGHESLGRAIRSELEADDYDVVVRDGLRGMSERLSRFFRWMYAFLVLRAAPVWGGSVVLFTLRPVVDASRLVAGGVFGRGLERIIGETRPDLVISAYPIVTDALGWLRRAGRIRIPVVAVISDYGVHPLWVSRDIDLHVTPSLVSARMTERLGGSARVGRIPVETAFRSPTLSRACARAQLEIEQEAYLAVVAGGSLGMGDLGEAVEHAARAGATVVAVTGRNEERRQALARRFTGRGRVTILGWTEEMPALLAAADCLLVNAGGMTCLEAMALGVPVVMYNPVPGHGRMNAAAMRDAGAAIWARSGEELESLLADAIAGRCRLPVAAVEPSITLAEAIAPILSRDLRRGAHEIIADRASLARH